MLCLWILCNSLNVKWTSKLREIIRKMFFFLRGGNELCSSGIQHESDADWTSPSSKERRCRTSWLSWSDFSTSARSFSPHAQKEQKRFTRDALTVLWVFCVLSEIKTFHWICWTRQRRLVFSRVRLVTCRVSRHSLSNVELGFVSFAQYIHVHVWIFHEIRQCF